MNPERKSQYMSDVTRHAFNQVIHPEFLVLFGLVWCSLVLFGAKKLLLCFSTLGGIQRLMKRIFVRFSILFLAFSLQPLAFASAIPDRPEKLSFPPLNYEPPKPADYRVQLKAGP